MMKKILILLVLFLINFGISNKIFAEKSITVSAIVGEINHMPKITITSPANLDSPGEVLYIQNGTFAPIDFGVTDFERDDVFYTISPSSGVVSIESGGPFQTQSGVILDSAKVQFRYLAPTGVYGPQKITLTANDGVSVSFKEVNIYLY